MKLLMKCLVAAGSLLASSAIALAANVTIKVAYENNPGEPVDQVMHHWKEDLEKRSNGEITLELYPSSQLGSKKDVTEQAMMGLNVITITDVGFLADYDPDLGVLFGPYLADDPAKLFKIYDGEWFKKKSEALKAKGIHIVLPNYLYGVRQLITRKPVRTPDDLKGMKIRVPNNNMQIKIFEAMGATPTPMPLGETFPALAQGVIDGVENPISVLYGQKFQEEAKYLSMIGYLTNTAMFVGGEAFFSTLPQDQLKLIEETAYEAGLYSQKLTTEQDEQMIAKMKEAGVEVIEVNKEPFKELTKKVYTEFPEWSPGLYEQIQAELK
ncbi:C4-dicarboxylate TRAP transporter substrate-binding protein [Mesorhizobium sp. BAC0120]|uniref:C4-dicarboxylate TRAP transporter substrate-binding protein n=1 Tax=Mesorhizobium sp. BAC0120 TaxID=3090670 RepID=UPI00298CDA7E|nr:C4-dicarboxylate TRAP transporter substrate-binding protein [Mesorhizobium sp. BAC0120]MDW6020762.1 C4-dicarboxylate TRAP transporter substrate-binding protein [Mesorhizobium sp. BAC0120]